MDEQIDNLEQHLTCPVCLSQFCNPKTLPCLHSFCLKCIQQQPVDKEKGKYVVSCPTCRKAAQLPHDGLHHFPTAFIINSFMEIQEQLKKVSEGKQISCDNCEESSATRYCKQCATGFCEKCLVHHNGLKANAKHQIMDMKDVVTTVSHLLPVKQAVIMNCTDHNKPLEIFCETCQELICHNCTVRRHRDHDYDSVDDTFPKHQQDIKTILEVVANKMFALQDVLTALTTREEDIAKQRDDKIKEIRCLIQSIIELVQQSGEQLVVEVGKVAEAKLQLLGQQKEEAETALVQVKSCKEFVEKSLEVGSPQQILSEKENLIEGMEVVSKQINPATFQPAEEASITFTENKMAAEQCESIGTVKCSFSIVGCIATTSVSPMAGRMSATLKLSLQTKLGSPCKIPSSLPLTCHLISPNSSQAIVCDVKEIGIGKYAVSFAPLTYGKHQVKLQVAGINIDGSPFSLDVPEMKGRPVKTISAFAGPFGVAVDKNGQMLVSERHGHCVAAYDNEGEKMGSFGSWGTKEGQFICPRGVAVTNDDHIVVADDHRLQKLTPDGRYVMSIGSCEAGSEPLQFNRPLGIAVHPTAGQLYVVDEYNHRIQVINDNFTYSHSIGSKGTAPGQLNRPHDVAIDAVGSVYIVSMNNHCVDVFTSDGKPLRRFGSQGSGDGQLSRPSSIAVDTNNLVYIAEYGNDRISIFTSDGQFITCIGRRGRGEEEFNGPFGVTVDMFGKLYVCDYGNSRVVVL